MSIRIGIDFGTSETDIYSLHNGIIVAEPTVAAFFADGDKIKATGSDAKKLIGKTAENTRIVFPVFEGEVVNEKIAGEVIKDFLKQAGYKKPVFSSETVIASVPCGADGKLIKKLENALKIAGFSKAVFIEAPVLSAFGQNVPLNESSPMFVIDMGGGTTNIAALSSDGVITGISATIGGKNIDVKLIDYIADKFGLQIGLLSAERLKTQVGSLFESDKMSMVINGRDLTTGRPRSEVIKALDIIEPIKRYYDKVFDLATEVLSKLPAEVSAEIRHSGIYLSGGASAIAGLDVYYSKKFSIPVKIAEKPKLAVALGLGAVISNPELIKKVKLTVSG